MENGQHRTRVESDIYTCLISTPARYLHCYRFYTCLICTPVWHLHLSDMYTCLTFTPVWHLHLPDIYTCLIFTPAWYLHLLQVLPLSDIYTCLTFTPVSGSTPVWYWVTWYRRCPWGRSVTATAATKVSSSLCNRQPPHSQVWNPSVELTMVYL